MSLEGISEALESPDFYPTDNSTEWNGKDVRTLSSVEGAWLILKIPFGGEAIPPLGDKITSVNSRRIPTVEQVLERHNLQFAPTGLGQREVEQLTTSEHGWLIIPLFNTNAPSLEGKVVIDTNDHRTIQKILERNGVTPSVRPDPFFTMTTFVLEKPQLPLFSLALLEKK